MSDRFADTTLADFAARLAEKVPSPGGGAVAAVTLAHGAALGAMVLRYTVGRPAFAAHEPANAAALAELDAMRATALALADRDASAY
ncbi:MAG: cyclodeaminase/cyclohydrolase family protein, partial [Planctomycetota bacterium]